MALGHAFRYRKVSRVVYSIAFTDMIIRSPDTGSESQNKRTEDICSNAPQLNAPHQVRSSQTLSHSNKHRG